MSRTVVLYTIQLGTFALQNRILPRISDRRDTAFRECLTFWSNVTSATPLIEPASHRQRAWDRLVVCGIRDSLLAECVTDIKHARFLGACASHSGVCDACSILWFVFER